MSISGRLIPMIFPTDFTALQRAMGSHCITLQHHISVTDITVPKKETDSKISAIFFLLYEPRGCSMTGRDRLPVHCFGSG